MSLENLRIPRQKVILGAGLGFITRGAGGLHHLRQEAPGVGRHGHHDNRSGARHRLSGAGSPGPAAPANAIAKTADVPVGSGVIVDEVVVTQPSAGEFKGFSAICTHAGCTVNEVADGTINCPCHGSKFNLDGSVANGPASTPLESQAVTVQGDSIVLG